MADLPDRACPHDHHQVAILAEHIELFDDRLEGMQVHRGDAAFTQSIHEVGGGDPPLLLFAVTNEVDGRNDHDVRSAEGVGELVEQEPGSTVLVRLEHADQSLGLFRLVNRPQGGVAFTGMVAVVIEDGDGSAIAAFSRAESFQSSSHALETAEGGGDAVPVGAEPRSDDGRGRATPPTPWAAGVRLVASVRLCSIL